MSSVKRAISGSDWSRQFQTRPSRPPGRRTRWISASARSPSNQWNAWATVTASTAPSGSGISSAVPASARTPGSDASSALRIASTGSPATTLAPAATSSRVSARRLPLLSPLRAGDVGIDADEARALLTGGALLLDVRRPDDRTEPLVGAERVPPDEIPTHLANLDRTAPILLACT